MHAMAASRTGWRASPSLSRSGIITDHKTTYKQTHNKKIHAQMYVGDTWERDTASFFAYKYDRGSVKSPENSVAHVIE